jgi:predicted GH43/DUF377 family glycosyl hydrolase
MSVEKRGVLVYNEVIRRRYKMITKYKDNPIIKPRDVKPSMDGYQVLGSFNPGCEPWEGYVRVPVYRFEVGEF